MHFHTNMYKNCVKNFVGKMQAYSVFHDFTHGLVILTAHAPQAAAARKRAGALPMCRNVLCRKFIKC